MAQSTNKKQNDNTPGRATQTETQGKEQNKPNNFHIH